MLMFPANESERLQALRDLQILDTGPEPHYDAICDIACSLFEVPVALVTFVDETRQWFKARRGTDLTENRREEAFCRYTILRDEVTVFEDLASDPRFAGHPVVAGEPHIRFYAGVPLALTPGLRIGTLCLFDVKARKLSGEEVASLERLAAVVVAHLRLHQAHQTIAADLKELQARDEALAVQARSLRRREAMIAQTETLADLGTWEIDLDTREVAWSDNLYRIYDRPVGAPVTAENAREAYDADGLAAILAAMEALGNEGRGFELTLPFTSAAGRRRTVRIVGSPELVDGRPKRAFGIVQDITDQVASAQALEERNRLLTLAEELAHIGHWRIDLKQRSFACSDELKRIVGLSPASPAPKLEELQTFYHPDDRERLKGVRDAVRAGRDYAIEARLVRPDGESRTVQVRGIGERDGTGAVRAYFGVVIDITERKRVEEALKESTRQLTATLETMDQGLVMVDATQHVQIANRRALDLLGLPAELMNRKPHQDEVRAYQVASGEFDMGSPAVQHWLHHAGLTTDHPIYVRERPNGTVLEIRTAPLPGGGAVRTFTDVTERQRRAEELTRAKEAAETAQARAELASQAKSEFLASMSHEIRTPLNGILGYADLLIMGGALQPEQRQHVERIQSAGSALLTVVDDVLDFARIEAGEVRLDPGPFSPRALADDAVSIVRSIAERKGLTVSVAADDALPAVLVGDEARLRQVLLNLLNNAVKFTREGSVEVDVTATQSAGDAALTIRVRDTGIGIPADRQQRLFQRFSQVDGSIRREFGGTGLGLAISKELIDRMGGRIGVASEEGQGSTFWFTIQLPLGEALALPASFSETPAPNRPARILLVEDLEVNRDLARAVLEAAGHHVEIVSDGAQAVAAVQARAYDVVLMDIQMPVMDGITATRQIRALDHPAYRLPIIAMTANVLPQQITAYREAGMTDHVGKPFKRQDLYAALERAMKTDVNPTIQEIVDGDGPVLDRAILAELMEVGGAPMVQRLLDQFAANYKARFADPSPDQVARDAHALVSSAGMLGLTRLSQACARLEAACESAADVTPLLTGVRAEAEAALAAASAWKRDAA